MRKRKARKEHKISAILHSGYPVRHWDHDLGPDQPRLFVLEDEPQVSGTVDVRATKLRLVTEEIGVGLCGAGTELSPDGSFAVVGVFRPVAKADNYTRLERIDLDTGERSVLIDEPDARFTPGPISPDNSQMVVTRESITDPAQAMELTLWLFDFSTGNMKQLVAEWDHWAAPQAWLPRGERLVVTADHRGRSPIFLIDISSGDVTQISTDDASYSNVLVSPDGNTLYALRSSYAFPAEAVRIDLQSGEVSALLGPVARPELPGRIEEISTTAADGAEVRAWLVLPKEGKAPHPMLLWVHGGPLGSWNSWSWRWNPMIMAARGYAVLLPDPAMST